MTHYRSFWKQSSPPVIWPVQWSSPPVTRLVLAKPNVTTTWWQHKTLKQQLMKTSDTCKTKPNKTKVSFRLPFTPSIQETDCAYSTTHQLGLHGNYITKASWNQIPHYTNFAFYTVCTYVLKVYMQRPWTCIRIHAYFILGFDCDLTHDTTSCDTAEHDATQWHDMRRDSTRPIKSVRPINQLNQFDQLNQFLVKSRAESHHTVVKLCHIMIMVDPQMSTTGFRCNESICDITYQNNHTT